MSSSPVGVGVGVLPSTSTSSALNEVPDPRSSLSTSTLMEDALLRSGDATPIGGKAGGLTPRSRSAVRKDEVFKHTIGRAPWYGPDGTSRDAYVIGIAGGSASGKTSVAQAILKSLNNIPTVLILSQDSFYRQHTQDEIDQAFRNDLDLDHPDAIDAELFAKCLLDLKKGRATQIPVYSFVQHQRLPQKKYQNSASVIIVEGIMTLTSPSLRDLYDLRIFVNADSDLMLARRIRRDIAERGRDVDGVIDQYLRFVKRAYDNFILPSSKWADIIVPGMSNQVAIDLLVAHIQRQLESRTMRFRGYLSQGDRSSAKSGLGGMQAVLNEDTGRFLDATTNASSLVTAGPRLTLLKQTNQLQGLLTLLRDRTLDRSDFIFYADRLSSLVVEEGLSLLKYEEVKVQTPIEVPADGMRMKAKELVGVTLLRSGGPFAKGLRRVIRDVKLGSLLIQSDPATGEPLLFHTSFPECLQDSEQAQHAVVVLMDSQIGTGAAALMAIRVLLDHGVKEHHIIFLSYLVAAQGIATIARAFPRVRVVAATIGQKLEERNFTITEPTLFGQAGGDADFAGKDISKGVNNQAKVKRAWVIEPDLGHIGDRYYLT